MENVFEDAALQKYLKDIANIQPLTKKAEHELAIKSKNGDFSAQRKLIESNLKFVVKVATKYQNRGLTLSELISEGNIGLIKAIEKYDINSDNKLISYAVWWIKQRILFAIAEKTNIIKIPLSKNNLAKKITKAEKDIFEESGRIPTVNEIAEKTKLTVSLIEKTKREVTATLSIEQKIDGTNTSERTFADILATKVENDPQKLYYREKQKKQVSESLKKLSEREHKIIGLYFGLNDESPQNFAEIGRILSLSRERVRQIYNDAFKKILAEINRENEFSINY
ncbi:MAG: RNA polymerase sigma factor RpoD/SigA [Candidatus Cloacimonetes bacterium]|jgi:RNA polymerase primary sigma factor|nr:RNA polymerase sigma factor RpoD/SigA [Candidatus Cloacimonadota bacterium]MBT6993485.1 RNA polymerase sigma factor RpoD/SigA [Candidatus Cloacimonadota bacterium]MBT7468787.1 RNA polymerase sigma factor RpoD/SigA [Candidatus Cloacimonadota bacterium]